MPFNIIVATSHNVKLLNFACKLFILTFLLESLVYIIATTA
jgi:hypothetical protein